MSDDDLSILYPQREITVGGRALTVHELTFEQSLRLHATVAPLLDLLATHYDSPAGIGSDTVIDALAQHPQVACALLAAATGQPAEWIGALPEHEGYLLMMVFVGVHVPFFVARLETRAVSARAVKALAAMQAAKTSAKSSRGSSATGTPTTH